MEDYDFSRRTHYTVSVVVVHEHRILLLKQDRSEYWVFPGGHINDDELPGEAAIREVKEETSLTIELLEKSDENARTKIAVPLPTPHHVTMLPCRDKRDVDLVFTAKVLSGTLRINEESKEGKWFSKDEILSNPKVGPYTKYYAAKILEENPDI